MLLQKNDAQYGHGEIPALTGLRGIAALWVLLYQVIWTDTIPVIRDGYLGVDLFFLLSGFVLSHVYTKDLERVNFRAYSYFLFLRIVRIYPAHILTLFAMSGMVLLPGFAERYPLHGSMFSAKAFAANLILIQAWIYWWPLSWNQAAWSLSAEWLGYLSFPILLPAIRRYLPSPRSCALLAAGLLSVTALAGEAEGTLDFHGLGGLGRMVTEFVAGCLLYRSRRAIFGLPGGAATVAAAALTIMALSSRVLIGCAPFAFGALLILASDEVGIVVRALEWRPIVFVGEISYSLYMLDWPTIQLTNWIAPQIGWDGTSGAIWRKIVVASVIVAASILCYHLFEKPIRQWGRRRAAQAFCPGRIRESRA